ncbi:hypothetical protein BUE93_08630 [Chromobacterium amazonense]|uniref:Uncharacterized protein n=1 Tax=Chromobacterium amazonense TaxID=1382803 RepID=A0A2S9X5K7_9NEIS|nr:hypothetical protein [Chromobacterium amazonense]PRP71011.1 hypothetical protein BUE93_08630 [Chromobacterium amazonense]
MSISPIKDFSALDLERAVAETLEDLTGKPWRVSIGEISYPSNSETPWDDQTDRLKLTLSAQEDIALPHSPTGLGGFDD